MNLWIIFLMLFSGKKDFLKIKIKEVSKGEII